MIQKITTWLSKEALPLWLHNGIDTTNGSFEESLDLSGNPISIPRRVMVQARQIYSLSLAVDLNVCDKERALSAIEVAASNMIKNYTLSSGAFAHSINSDGTFHDQTPDLYAQAFVLFGLAHAYAKKPQAAYKERALSLLNYLQSSRRAPRGGYTEITAQGLLFVSNPHMHLFEAFVSWMEVDKDSIWKKEAEEILNLCLNKFIDPATNLLAEYFDQDWNIIRHNQRFIFEPGHQYEWAWLMGRFQKLTGKNLDSVRFSLFNQSEKYGVHPNRGAVYDEVWSDLNPKSTTSRFWPQTERIKAALQIAQSTDLDRKKSVMAADQGMEVLFKFFDTPQKGLWFDRWLDNGDFQTQPAKASSLYHIIAALHDYVKIRPTLEEPT